MSNQSSYQNKTLLIAAQLKSLVASPVLLIPGEAGCVIELQSAYFRLLSGATPFNPGAGDALVLFTGTTSHCLTSLNPVPATGFLDQTTDQSAWATPSFSSVLTSGNPPATPLSDIVGAGGYLTQFNTADTFPMGTDWTTGGGALLVFLRWSYLPIGEL